MARAGELDWSDLYEKTSKQELKKSEESFNWLDYRHDRTKEESTKVPEPLIKEGETPYRPSNAEIAEYILRGTQNSQFRQATDQEMFGHLVASEEQIQKAEQDFNETFNKFFTQVQEKKGPSTNAFGLDDDWKPRSGSFIENLSKSEREAYESRQKEIDKDWM